MAVEFLGSRPEPAAESSSSSAVCLPATSPSREHSQAPHSAARREAQPTPECRTRSTMAVSCGGSSRRRPGRRRLRPPLTSSPLSEPSSRPDLQPEPPKRSAMSFGAARLSPQASVWRSSLLVRATFDLLSKRQLVTRRTDVGALTSPRVSPSHRSRPARRGAGRASRGICRPRARPEISSPLVGPPLHDRHPSGCVIVRPLHAPPPALLPHPPGLARSPNRGRCRGRLPRRLDSRHQGAAS
jgi:hypothetical protein